MEDIDVDDPLVIKANEFLESRKYSNNLTDLIASLENPDTITKEISVLQLIFVEILKRRTMFISSTNKQETDVSVSDYILWLQESYKTIWKKLIGLMSSETFSEQATNALFTLLGQEGKYPIVSPKKGVYYFPETKLKIILKKCFTMQSHFSGVQNQLDEFTNFIDNVYYFWLITSKLLENLKNPNEKLISHVLEILQKIPIPSEDELNGFTDDLLLCFAKNKPKFRPKYKTLQESIQTLWNLILRWKCRNKNHKKALILLLDNVMPHLMKPILTMDYLMESLNTGGIVSLLALQGIFVLVKDHNLEYPNIYGKLYTFFHHSIFYTKYKSRLYVLTNIFLSSTHLPESLIASFIKRFSRLCLCAPPEDIIILSAFIANLLIRHPSLKVMIQHPTSKSVPTDPFIENEENPFKTNALESSLWELETLQHHVLPEISKAVSFINKPLPKTECDLTTILGTTFAQIFEKQSKKKLQKVSLTFEQPESLALPRTNYFSDLWCFEE